MGLLDNIFGTDGIRGQVGQDPITVESVLALGKAIGSYFLSCTQVKRARPKIVIGKDTRKSNYMLEQAVSAGICSIGMDSMLLGPIPTPGISFLTHSMRADAGIVISASHNPHYYNGLKVFDRHGEKITIEQEKKITALYERFRSCVAVDTEVQVGKCKRLDDVLGRYIVHLKSFFPDYLSLDGTPIVLDCAHGATYKVAPIIFRELDCDITCFGTEPDGANINREVGSTYIEHLQKKMQEHPEAEVGFAFDGDGDRCIPVSKNGLLFDGDRIVAMMVKYYIEYLKHPPKAVVLTEMSNSGLMSYLKALNVEVYLVPVGDRNVRQEMIRTQAFMGAEPSGHVIFGDQFNTGDGILLAVNVLRVMADSGRPLSDFYDLYQHYPSVMVNVDVSQKPPLESLQTTQRLIAQTRSAIGTDGKVLVRYSGTEPLARIMVEGANESEINRFAQDIAASIKEEISLQKSG